MEKLSKSLEDYLKAMVALGGTTAQSVKPSAIAHHMGVSKTSAGKALTTLREKHYIDQPYYGEATFTEKGFEYATSIQKKHRVLCALLIQEIGIPEDVARDEACLMEHALSDDSFQKLVLFLEQRGVAL